MAATTPPPKHLLVVEDDPTLRDLYRELFAGEGYAVTVAGAAPDLPTIRRLRPDLALVDYLLNRRRPATGLLHALRADPATADLPVIVCTGAVDAVREAEEELRALDVGLVFKPFDLDDLLAEVGRRLGGDPA